MSNYRVGLHDSVAHEKMKAHWKESGVGVEEVGWGVKAHVVDGLFNPVSTQRFYTREKPWHRVVAELAATGHTCMEICNFTGRSRRSVQMVLAQPYAQERIAKKAAMNASEEIREILEKAAPESLRRVIKLAEDGATSEDMELRKLAAQQDQAILDRFLGRPNQPITNTAAAIPAEKLTDKELDQRIASNLSLIEGGHSLPATETEYS